MGGSRASKAAFNAAKRSTAVDRSPSTHPRPSSSHFTEGTSTWQCRGFVQRNSKSTKLAPRHSESITQGLRFRGPWPTENGMEEKEEKLDYVLGPCQEQVCSHLCLLWSLM